MQDNGSVNGKGVVCRLRSTPRFLGVAALAVPVVAGVGVAATLPAWATGSRPSATAGTTNDTVQLASHHSGGSSSSAKKDGDGDGSRKHSEHSEKKSKKHHKKHGKKDGLPRVTQEQALTAYFDAGYGYEDAQKLAKIWHRKGDIVDIKVLAGRKLLAGRELPVAPSYPAVSEQDLSIRAFLDAGYGYDDAVLLANLYGLHGDAYQGKVLGGDKLRGGIDLPTQPGDTAWTVADETARSAFFNNGYGYDDAVEIAKLWNVGDEFEVKADAGRKLLAGLPLPVEPSASEGTSAQEQKALDAYFAAGYGYDDAVALAEYWGGGMDPYQAKVLAGDKLLAGLDLPVLGH